MSDNSYLTIGDVVFTWRYHVPTFLTFVFEQDDLFVEREKILLEPGEEPRADIDPDELLLLEAGFRTTVGAAKRRLDLYGYTLPFFATIYDSFRAGLQETVRDALGEDISQRAQAGGGDLAEDQLQIRIDAHLSASPDTSLGDLEALIRFLREAIEGDLKTGPFADDISFDRGQGQQPARVPVREHVRIGVKELARFESLQWILFDRASQVPADVLRPLALFDEGYVSAFPEVVSLLYTRLLLDVMPDEALVELDVRQVVQTEAEVRALHSDLAYELLHKVEVYERVFRALSVREEDVQDRYARAQVRNALADLGKASSSQAKGEALESLMTSTFSIPPQLLVVERNYSTGDEEIDLIVKNNVERPFWQSLGSPLFFVECKNWTAPVGAPEVRGFEVKLQNHAPMTRLGILVAPGGFTDEAVSAVKRSSRDPYSVALVEREDLERLAFGGESVLDWLERILCRPI